LAAALFTIGLLLAACSSSERGDVTEEEVTGTVEARDFKEETFNVGRMAQLELQNINGNITLKTGKSGQVIVRATRQARGNDAEEARSRLDTMSVDLQGKGDAISVAADVGTIKGSKKPAWAGKRVDLLVITQEDTAVRLTDGAGSITIAGITGGVSISAGTIKASLSNIRGGVSVVTQSGVVIVDGASGPAKFESRDASFSIARLSSPSLSITSSADITIKDTQVEGDIAVKSTSGKLSLQRLKGRSIKAEVGPGNIEVTDATADKGITLEAHEGRVYVNRVNSELLKIVTSSGNIDLTEVQGGLELTTDNGRIGLFKVMPSSLVVKGGAGNVALNGQLPQVGEGRVRTTSGAISVTVPRETSLALDATTKGGKISVDPKFGLVLQDSSAGRVRGMTNGGTMQLTLVSESGNISVGTGQH